MKVLVLGGTGAMGKPIVQILAERGHLVYVTTRKNNKTENSNIIYVQGDAHDIKFIDELLKEKYDAIIDFMIYSLEEFATRSAIFLENTAQYVFLSSARVYADSKGQQLTEAHPRLLDVTEDSVYLKTNEYALLKAKEEDVLVNGARNNYTIIRPYITYNDERLQLGVYEKEVWLYRALKGKTIIFSKDIAEKTTTLTYGEDVALRIADLIGEEWALGEVYHVATDRSIQWKDVLEVYLNTLEKNIGKRPNILMLDSCDKYTQKVSWYQLHYDRLYHRKFDTTKIQLATKESKEFVLAKEGLKKCLESFLKSEKNFLRVDWKREGAWDRITGERELLRNIPGLKNKIKYLLYRYNRWL